MFDKITNVPNVSLELFSIIEHKIIVATIEDGKTIKLTFENGYQLSVFDNSTQYEQYQIRIGKQTIIV